MLRLQPGHTWPPNWGSFHIPYTVIHLPQKLPSHAHSHAHPPLRPVTHPSDSPLTRALTHTHLQHPLTHTNPQTDGFTLPSDTSPPHTHPPCGWAITPSHNSETCFALLRHMIQTQALHPEKIEAEQTASGSEKQMPTRSILSSSESPQLFT